MLANARLIYLFIHVSDLAESRAFYEDTLGLPVLEEEPGCVKLDGGQVILALRPAAELGIRLPTGRDNGADVVFLVDDLETTRAQLEARGVKFLPTDWYQVGGIADFYDPDGHWLTLYQPSDEAMSWPSGDRIRAVVGARRNMPGPAHAPASTKSSNGDRAERPLTGSEIFYVFLFMHDPEEALSFYHSVLGLRDLEGGPCSRPTSGDEPGVVKYDTGGVLLSTHHIEGTHTETEVGEHTCPPRDLDLDHMKGVAPALYVRGVNHVVRGLSERAGLEAVVRRSDDGLIATYEDPSGHLVFLYEPSEQALRSASGARIREIVATPL